MNDYQHYEEQQEEDTGLEELKLFLLQLDLNTLKLLSNMYKNEGKDINNVFLCDSEKTLYSTRGYLNCLNDITKTLDNYIALKEGTV